MVYRPDVNDHDDDEILCEVVLVMLARFTADVVVLRAATGCHASLQVWHPHDAIEVLARGMFQPID